MADRALIALVILLAVLGAGFVFWSRWTAGTRRQKRRQKRRTRFQERDMIDMFEEPGPGEPGPR